MKTCSKCKIEKDEDEFYRIRKNEEKKHYWCKHCMKVPHKLSPAAIEHRNTYKREKRAQLRLETLIHYSNGLMKCSCCGESQERFLTLDHINNDGWKDKRKYGRSVMDMVKKQSYPEGYQILCYNCNCGRAHNKGVCPHEEI